MATNEIDEIRRKMAVIRRELNEDVRGVVAGAEAVSDWRHYIRLYPWASVGLALAIGYVVVPKRRPAVVTAADVAQAVAVEVPHALREIDAPKPKGRGLIGAGLGLLAPVLLRTAQNYATHFVSNWIASKHNEMAEMMAAVGLSGVVPVGNPPQRPSPEPTRAGGPNRTGGEPL